MLLESFKGVGVMPRRRWAKGVLELTSEARRAQFELRRRQLETLPFGPILIPLRIPPPVNPPPDSAEPPLTTSSSSSSDENSCVSI